MSIFRIICTARSYAALPQEINTAVLKLGKSQWTDIIRIKNKNSLNLIGQSFSNELHFECDINASDIFEAFGFTRGEIGRILDELAFIVGSPVYDLKMIKGYNITPEIEDREYVQYYYDVLDKVGSKSTGINSLNQFIYGFNKANNERIYRAVHWYRKSLNEFDPLDRFVYLWVGLETLNSFFQKLFPDECEIRKCKQCGWDNEIKGTSAMKAFFREVLKEENLYSKARDMRQVLHGHKDLNDVILQSLDINPMLTFALRTAICMSLGIKPDTLNYEINTVESEPIVFVFIAKLSHLDIDESKPDYEEADFSLEIKIESKEEHLVFQPIISTKIMDKGVSLAEMDWELLGETGYPFDKMQIILKC